MRLTLRGTRSNRDGIGAVVRATLDSGLVQTHVVSTASSYLSSSDPRVVIGLAGGSSAELEVLWPSGARQRRRATAGPLSIVEPE